MRSSRTSRSRNVQMQSIAGSFHAWLIHRFHMRWTDIEVSRVHNANEIEDFLPPSKIAGEECSAIIVELATCEPVIPSAGPLIDGITIFIRNELRTRRDG